MEAAGSLQFALWLLPCLVGLQLGQLLLSSLGWCGLFGGAGPQAGTFYLLRIVREGIDSLLPVAQVGGEIVGARLLMRRGVTPSIAGASIVVDVTVEFLTQLVFLAAGLCALTWLSHDAKWQTWVGALLAGAATVGSFVLAQRFGLLRAVEALARAIARRFPALGDVSLDGLHAAALDFYRQPGALLRCFALHQVAWCLGSIETWAVLHTLGVAVTPLQAFTIESLGMAARSAGFAIPAALGAQEGGFVLAAAAFGIPVAPALALSLVKRLREIVVGLIGLALWRFAARRAAWP
jgi:putative membrane protein